MKFIKIEKTNKIFFALAIFAITILVSGKVSAVEELSETLIPENTYAFCTDGEDNDDNGNTDFGDASCALFTIPVFASVEVLENTYELCTDSEDNDDNGNIDFGDASCAPFAIPIFESIVILENTYELCTNGEDDDDNGNTDFGDASCAPFAIPEIITPTTTPTTTPVTDDTSSSSRRSGGSKKRVVSNSPQGEVLGAFTGNEGSCGMYLTTYMREGMNNNPEEVKKLQTFLNEYMNAGLPVTGFFGPLTKQAAINLQNKYAAEILSPWKEVYPQISAVGYVYKTTRYYINNIKCPGSETMPVLN